MSNHSIVDLLSPFHNSNAEAGEHQQTNSTNRHEAMRPDIAPLNEFLSSTTPESLTAFGEDTALQLHNTGYPSYYPDTHSPHPTFSPNCSGPQYNEGSYSPHSHLHSPHLCRNSYLNNGHGGYYFNFSPRPTPQRPSSSRQVCRICGDTATGNHFGVLTCEACKSFFRRSVRAKARYACRGSRNCAVQKHTRNRCQYCRFQKCLSNGMRSEAVQDERSSGNGFLLSPQHTNTLSPSNQQLQSPSGSDKQRSRSNSLPTMTMEPDSLNFSSTIDSSPSSQQPFSTMDTPATSDYQNIISTLVNADRMSEPGLYRLTNDITLQDLLNGLKSSLSGVIRWAKRIPTFVSLSLDDQVKLLKSSWCEHCTLKLAAQNGPKAKSVLLANGMSCNRDQIEDPEVQRVIDMVFDELTHHLHELNMDREELACIQGILLCNPDAKGLSLDGKKKVKSFQEQILQSLETRTKTMYPVTPQRFSRLLLRLAPLKAISLEVMQHMEVQSVLNKTSMSEVFGELLI